MPAVVCESGGGRSDGDVGCAVLVVVVVWVG